MKKQRDYHQRTSRTSSKWELVLWCMVELKNQPFILASDKGGAESEFVSLSDVTCKVKYLRELSRGLGYPQRDATLVFEDNRAAILVAQNECSASGRMRHVDVKFRFVMETVKNKEIRVKYIQTDLS